MAHLIKEDLIPRHLHSQSNDVIVVVLYMDLNMDNSLEEVIRTF